MRFCFSQSQRNCSKSFVRSIWIVWHLLRLEVTRVIELLVNIALSLEFVSRIYSAFFEIKGTHLWSTLQIPVVYVFSVGVWLFPVILFLFIYLFSYFLLDCTFHYALFYLSFRYFSFWILGIMGWTAWRLAWGTDRSTEDDCTLFQSKWDCYGIQPSFPQMESVCKR